MRVGQGRLEPRGQQAGEWWEGTQPRRPALRHRPSGRGDRGDSPGTHTRALGEHAKVIPVELQLGPQQVLQFL